jgi:tetratricopeptide (TPR) repeat protein
VRLWYSIHLAELGRFDAASAEVQQAQELDPVSPFVSAYLGVTLFFAHRYDQLIQQMRLLMEIHPNQQQAHAFLALAYEQKGELSDAIKEMEKAYELDKDQDGLAQLGHIRRLALLGNIDLNTNTAAAAEDWNEILAIASRTGDQKWENRAKGELALVAGVNGDLGKAGIALFGAIAKAEQLGDVAAHINFATWLANGMAVHGAADQAVRIVDRAADLARKNGYPHVPLQLSIAKIRALSNLPELRNTSARLWEFQRKPRCLARRVSPAFVCRNFIEPRTSRRRPPLRLMKAFKPCNVSKRVMTYRCSLARRRRCRPRWVMCAMPMHHFSGPRAWWRACWSMRRLRK